MRALAFFSLVLAIVGLIFVNRSFSSSVITAIGRPNRSLVVVLIAVPALLGLTLAWPFAAGLFAFGPLHGDDLAVTFGAGVAVLVVLELLKSLWRGNLSKQISKKSKPKSMPSVLCRRHSRLQGKV